MTQLKVKTGPVTLSRSQLNTFTECPRCFWLINRFGVKQPKGYPLALNIAMDQLLKAEFDKFRAAGKPHPILVEHKVDAKLFSDTEKLDEWRNNFRGLRWADPKSGHTLYGAVDDILEFPDHSLAILDYKSSGAREVNIYDSYQLQIDVYTFLLQRLGYRTAPKAYFAFFVAVKDDGFGGRLPFRAELVAVTPQPDRVHQLFKDAVALVQSSQEPESGAECDVCRWDTEAAAVRAEGNPGRAPKGHSETL